MKDVGTTGGGGSRRLLNQTKEQSKHRLCSSLGSSSRHPVTSRHPSLLFWSPKYTERPCRSSPRPLPSSLPVSQLTKLKMGKLMSPPRGNETCTNIHQQRFLVQLCCNKHFHTSRKSFESKNKLAIEMSDTQVVQPVWETFMKIIHL